MATALKPPTPLPAELEATSVFLAGSIDMGASVNWQETVVEALSDCDVVLLNPRRDDWDSSWKQSIDNPAFRDQVEWELDGLERADVIAVYFAPNSKAPITLLELGLHAGSGKLVVCCPPGFWRRGNVEIVCSRFEIPMVADLDALIDFIRAAANDSSR